MNCQVEVSKGILQGKECKTYYGKKYYSFEGVPYAKPPVGKLRFRDPQEPDSWAGVRDATKLGNKCAQLNPFLGSPLEGSEDCLYLNVYTPSLPSEKNEKLPVLFFIHGGRLIVGYGGYYKPDYLLKHDVIFVTVNYRLNILGFMCLDLPEVPGNAGLKDTVMALKWVNENIMHFNGDVSNVTVMGESAGSGIVTSYLSSKMADGLFHKMVAESGVSISDLYVNENSRSIEMAKMVASNLDRTFEDVRRLYEFLVQVPVDDLIMAYASLEMLRDPLELKSRFLPVLEKEFDNERFLAEYPHIDVARNNYKKVPLLVGMNSYEGALFLQKDSDDNIVYENDLYHLIPTITNLKRDDKEAFEIIKKIRQFYFNSRAISNDTKLEYVNMLSDRHFNYDINNFVEQLSKHNPDVYFFKFQYTGNMNTRVMKSLGIDGASHGDVIMYQFYRTAKHNKGSERDMKIVDILNEILCNFIKSGTPSWTGQTTKWLPYTPTGKHVLTIDNKIQLVQNSELHRIKFWQSIIGELSKL